jgi:hypothetical protein
MRFSSIATGPVVDVLQHECQRPTTKIMAHAVETEIAQIQPFTDRKTDETKHRLAIPSDYFLALRPKCSHLAKHHWYVSSCFVSVKQWHPFSGACASSTTTHCNHTRILHAGAKLKEEFISSWHAVTATVYRED